MRVLIALEVILTLPITLVSSTISGLSYMDPLNYGPYKPEITGEDPCNPLYWYPRNIPKYCYQRSTLKPGGNGPHPPLPIPMPAPQPLPFPMPPPQTLPFPPGPMSPPMPYLPMPMIAPPLPYGIPFYPTNPMFPMARMPSPSPFLPYNPQDQIGLVPGIPGIVSDDGGINILPFSDAYSDLLQKNNQKRSWKKHRRIYSDYKDYPLNSRRRHRLN